MNFYITVNWFKIAIGSIGRMDGLTDFMHASSFVMLFSPLLLSRSTMANSSCSSVLFLLPPWNVLTIFFIFVAFAWRIFGDASHLMNRAAFRLIGVGL